MKKIKDKGKYNIEKNKLIKIKLNFDSSSMNKKQIIETIKLVYNKYNIVLDPHSAIGYGAFDRVKLKGNNIVLATAHPCKFPDAVKLAIKKKQELPNALKYIMTEKENYEIMPNNLQHIQSYIKNKI